MEKKRIWKSYIAAEALSTTKRVEPIDKKEFTKAALNGEPETFVINIAALKASPRSIGMTIYPSQVAQIAALKQNEAPTKVSSKYANYANVLSFHLAMELLENTGINKQIMKLEKGKQPPYRSIYSLGPMELEILKT